MHLIARGNEELNTTYEELRTLTPEVRATALDLTEAHAAQELAAEISQTWCGLDILVTNAGSAPQGSFLALSDDDWLAGFGLKLFAISGSSSRPGHENTRLRKLVADLSSDKEAL